MALLGYHVRIDTHKHLSSNEVGHRPAARRGNRRQHGDGLACYKIVDFREITIERYEFGPKYVTKHGRIHL